MCMLNLIYIHVFLAWQHPFLKSLESIWSLTAKQNRLSNPSTCATDLFVSLHGMLFTHIQLDDFTGTLACFVERLEMEGEGVEGQFKLTTRLTFSMLSYALKNPTQKASPFAWATLNPYLTIALTFLSTISKHPATLHVLERSTPWVELVGFPATVPRNIMLAQGLNKTGKSERWAMLSCILVGLLAVLDLDGMPCCEWCPLFWSPIVWLFSHFLFSLPWCSLLHTHSLISFYTSD